MEPGDIVGTWRVGARVSAPGKAQYNVTCIHCGAMRVLRKDYIATEGKNKTHIGCPRVSHLKRYQRDESTPPGDSDCWAKWSAELHMNPELRHTWPASRVHSVECWRSNQAAAQVRMTIDDWAMSRRGEV